MLNKSRKDFIISVLWHILSIKDRINFLQLGRFGSQVFISNEEPSGHGGNCLNKEKSPCHLILIVRSSILKYN
jgi:hypothetical protein